jgi:hypothetical protein
MTPDGLFRDSAGAAPVPSKLEFGFHRLHRCAFAIVADVAPCARAESSAALSDVNNARCALAWKQNHVVGFSGPSAATVANRQQQHGRDSCGFEHGRFSWEAIIE